MDTVFVKALFDIDCEWEGLPPIYRVYVNDDLFTERTWIWSNQFLTEMLQIQAVPGIYKVQVSSVGPIPTDFHIKNNTIAYGPAKWLDQNTLQIDHEST